MIALLATIPFGCAAVITHGFATSGANRPTALSEIVSQTAAYVGFWIAGIGLSVLSYSAFRSDFRYTLFGGSLLLGILPILGLIIWFAIG